MLFAKNTLHGGAHTFGFLMGASGIGALTGAIYMATRKSVIGLVKIIPFFTAVFGLGLVAVSFTTAFLPAVLLMTVVGFGMIMQNTGSNTVLQTVVPDNMRGRVMSLHTMAFMGTAPFGSLLAGWMAKVIGVPKTLAIGGLVCVVGGIVFARKIPALKKVIEPLYIKLGILPR